LLGANITLFVVIQVGLEPWRREKLTSAFEKKVHLAFRELSRSEKERSEKEETERNQKDMTNEISLDSIGPTEKGEEVDLEENEKESFFRIPQKEAYLGYLQSAVFGGLVTALTTWFFSR
jgi:sensitive to high expression protein 9, mitochondrial